MSARPLIAICGTTGVGKSKLAIEIAQALSQTGPAQQYGGFSGARIINADAMQVYAGMDIVTNKVPLEEQGGVEHLLMGFKRPGEQYVVGQWVKDAMRLINETHQRNQLPIVVGGTTYWIQHLVFPGRLAVFDESSPSPSSLPATPPSGEPSESFANAYDSLSPDLKDLFNNLSDQPPLVANDPDGAFAYHRLLASLDPTVAQRWHWKDTRKVMRSLKIIRESGKLCSDIIREQSGTEPLPRYRTLFFWLYARPDQLEPRLDARVDSMLQQGLLDEVDELIRSASEESMRERAIPAEETGTIPMDFTLGIYQSIGYREFSSYLSQYPRLSSIPEDTAFKAAVERMKISTRQYARRQVKWIRNKLLPAVCAANETSEARSGPELDVVPTFLLDATELGDKWISQVQAPALHITQGFLECRSLPDPLSLSETARVMLSVADKPVDPAAVLEARRKVVCRVCTMDKARPVMIEEGGEWEAHVRSKRHRNLLLRAKRPASSHDVSTERISQSLG